jgi:hypothetical protein
MNQAMDKHYIGQCIYCGYALYETHGRITTRNGCGCTENDIHEVSKIAEKRKEG